MVAAEDVAEELAEEVAVDFLRGVFAFFIGHAFYLLILIPRSQFWLLPPWCVVLIVLVLRNSPG